MPKISGLSVSCGILFASFSFIYLYWAHGETMRLLHAGFSPDNPLYDPLLGSLLITTVLWLLQVVLNLYTKFHRIWQAASFFPSYFLLGLLTCVRGDGSTGVFKMVFDWSWWYILIGILIYAILIFLKNRLQIPLPAKINYRVEMVPNLIMLLIFTCMTGLSGNNDEVFHHELKTARAITSEDCQKALSVGIKSLNTSHTLSTLRFYALSQTDSLPQCLFRYPQVGLRQVFFDESDGASSIITNNDLYAYLGGVKRRSGETIPFYLRRVCRTDSTSHKAIDYYLSALLLERQLETFVKALDTYVPDSVPLGVHYQEALVLYCKRNPEYTDVYGNRISQTVRDRFEKYLALQAEHLHPQVERNYAFRRFGNTYWCYFWYVE